MFLDYDGTLSPIVERPDEAFMSDDMRAAVKRVSAIFTTIVVSGRAKDKVRNFIDLDENLMYAGSHGFDIAGPGGLAYQVGTRFLPLLSEAFALLSAAVAAIPGASVENNRFSVTVHWRLVDESRVAEVEAPSRERLALVVALPLRDRVEVEQVLREGLVATLTRGGLDPLMRFGPVQCLARMGQTGGLQHPSVIQQLMAGDAAAQKPRGSIR